MRTGSAPLTWVGMLQVGEAGLMACVDRIRWLLLRLSDSRPERLHRKELLGLLKGGWREYPWAVDVIRHLRCG